MLILLFTLFQTPSLEVGSVAIPPFHALDTPVQGTITVTNTGSSSISGWPVALPASPYLSITFQGTEEVSWAVGESRTLAFNFFLYGHPNFCATGNPTFSLEIMGPTALQVSDPGSLLTVEFVPEGWRLTQLLTKRQTPFLGWMAESTWTIPFQVITGNPVTGANERVFLYLDWDTPNINWRLVFNTFQHQISNSPICATDFAYFLVSGNLVAQPITDGTGTIPGTNQGVVKQAAAGGGGGVNAGLGTGINVFDVTQFNDTCSGTIKAHYGFSITNPPPIIIENNRMIVFRDFRLYKASPNLCPIGSYVFGDQPLNFKWKTLYAQADGHVSFSVDVPAAWKQNPTTLKADYEISYTVIGDQGIELIPGGRNLAFSGQMSQPLGPDVRIQATITHLLSGAQTTQLSPALALELGGLSFTFMDAESPADVYLDPGERFQASAVSVHNRLSQAIQQVSISLDHTGSQVFRTQVGMLPSTLFAGQTVMTTLDYELLWAEPGEQETLTASATYQTPNGFAGGFQWRFPITCNADPTQMALSLDDTWLAFQQPWATFPNTANTPTTAWTWQGSYWEGLAPDPNTVYSLQSPIFPILEGGEVGFAHNPGLPLSGGVMEYRVFTEGQPGPWRDWIQEQSGLPTDFRYNNTPYFSTPANAFSGRKAWYYRDFNPAKTLSPRPAAFDSGDSVQFRFAYQEPAWQSGWAHTQWRITQFTYQGTGPGPDFALGLGGLESTCSGLPVELNPQGNEFQVSFYATFQDVLDETSSQTNLGSPPFFWEDPPIGNPNAPFYWAEVQDLISGTRRIVQIPIHFPDTGGPQLNPLDGYPLWLTQDATWDLMPDGIVNIQDYLLVVNALVCAEKRKDLWRK